MIRRWPVVFGPEVIPAGKTVEIERPLGMRHGQDQIIVDRAILTSQPNADIWLDAILADGKPVDDSQICARSIAPGLLSFSLKFIARSTITLKVRNTSDKNYEFSMTLIGIVGTVDSLVDAATSDADQKVVDLLKKTLKEI